LQLKIYESPVNSGVMCQKIGTARSCRFPTDTVKFGQNFDRKFQRIWYLYIKLA